MKVINYLGNKIGSGGIESFVTSACAGMKEAGVEYVVCVNYKTDNIYEQSIVANDGKVVYLLEHKVSYIRKLIAFVGYLKKNTDAIVYFHASTAGMYLYAYIAKLIGIKRIVYHVHSTSSPRYGGLKKRKDQILRKLFQNIPNVKVACSEKAGRDLYGYDNFLVVHNGIDLERFRYNQKYRLDIRNELGLEGQYVIGQIGRLCYPKNQEFTLQILKEYIDNIDDNIVLLFIGEGNDRKKLENYIEKNELDDHVRFISPTNRIENYYQAIDVLMFPSVFEGLGIVAIEAQASGLPVLCSEYIVREVFVTDLIHQLKLQQNSQWVECLKKIKAERTDRKIKSEYGIDCCLKSGFSLNDTRRELLKIYNCYNLSVL